MNIKTIREADAKGKRVLLRTSLNVPISKEGEVADSFRLKRALATIEFLVKQGSKIIVVGYIGRKGETLLPVLSAFKKLAPEIPIRFFDGPIVQAKEEADALPSGECLMLENIRREEGEERNEETLAKELASLGDVFVNDAFAEAHRAYASNVGVAKFLPSYAGLLMEEEIEKLNGARTPPPGSIALIGGEKFETKAPLLEKLVPAYEKVFVGGALGNDLLKARGTPVGVSVVSESSVPMAIAASERFIVPSDVTVLNPETNVGRSTFIADVRAHEKIFDIGPHTALAWAEEVSRAPFVLWNGPMGRYEEGYIEGTNVLAEAVGKASGRVVVGGGNTAAALAHVSFDSTRVFVSTGGGACLQFLANGTLPAIDALYTNA